MRFITKTLSLIALAGSLAAADAVVDADKADIFKDVPKEARATIEKEAKGAKIEDIDRETKDGKVYYEAELEQGEKSWEICVAADGTLVKDHKHTDALEKAPSDVKTAITKEAGSDQVTKVKRHEKDNAITYEAKFKNAAGEKRTVWFDQDGKKLEHHK